MSSLAEKIAAYVNKLSFDELPLEVVRKSKQIILDTMGVMVLGAETPWSRIIADHYRSLGGALEAGIVGCQTKLPMAHAAFVNGTMAHSMDYDDDLYAVHGACCIIPAVLATAEQTNASGREVITAATIGYDLMVRLAVALDSHHLYAMGFHPTPVCGAFGAAAAVGRLLGLSVEQTANALGIVGSFASGSLEFLSDGAMAKRFHGGKAASEGIFAATLAKRGFTGPQFIFEGDNGVFKMFRAKGSLDRFIHGIYESHPIVKSYIKLHACCTCNAPVIDAIFALKNNTQIELEKIESVQIILRTTCLPLVGQPLTEKRNPKTVLEAQMSAPYCTAVALIADNVFPEQFTPEKIIDPEIRALAQNVWVTADPILDIDGDPRPVPAEVIISMNDGRIFRKKIVYQKGTYHNPLSKDELSRKFSICVGDRLSPDAQSRLRKLVEGLDSLENIQEVVEILRN